MPGFNIGDCLDRPLAEKIGTYSKILACGTVLRTATTGSSIWGSGWDGFRDMSHVRPERIYAVRGPLTRKACVGWGWKCPQIYGDPGILLPLYWQPRTEKKHKIGWCPHFKDNRVLEGAHLINVKTDDVQAFVDDLCSCEVVYSSSLHGLVIADAYGIPSRWVEVAGGWLARVKRPEFKRHKPPPTIDRPWKFKYQDYYASLGLSVEPAELGEGNPTLHPIPKKMQETLLSVCPWKN